MKILRAVATISGWTMISRVLGFVRDMLIAHVLGAGMVADAFFIAFKFPNLFRRLFGEGAMNAAFVPQYAGRLEAEGQASASRFASEAMSLMVAWMLLFTLIAMAAMPWIMTIQAAGFLDNPEKFDLTVALARITFPYLMFMVFAAILSGMLNSVGRFVAAAAAPVLLNITLVAALLALHQKIITMPGQTLSLAVAVAGALQFLLLVAACKRAGIMIPIGIPRVTPDMRKLLLLMAPGVVGAGVVQINVMVGDLLATLLEEGAVSYLYYADRINQLPLGVIGVAVGVALLPSLTRLVRAGDDAGAEDAMNRAIEISLILTLPAAFALAIMPELIVSTLFQRGAFSVEAATETAAALRAFALGLPAFVLIKALSPGFFAREDTKTPVKIAVVAMVLNLALAIWLMTVFAHAGIAAAAAISAWVNTALLFLFLKKRRLFSLDARLKRVLPRLLAACCAMAASLWFGTQLVTPSNVGESQRILTLIILVITGIVIFFGSATILGALSIKEVLRSLKRQPAPS